MDANSRDGKVFQAKLAEQAERFEEMVKFMKDVAEDEAKELSVDERNLLSVAYKNVIGSRRASWRVLSSIESKAEPKNLAAIKAYKTKIESELTEICQSILEIIKNGLIPRSSSEEAKVFYYKMMGDYYRYMAEYQAGTDRTEYNPETKPQTKLNPKPNPNPKPQSQA